MKEEPIFKVEEKKKKAIVCTVVRCKRFATEGTTVTGEQWYYCFKHGFVCKVGNEPEKERIDK